MALQDAAAFAHVGYPPAHHVRRAAKAERAAGRQLANETAGQPYATPPCWRGKNPQRRPPAMAGKFRSPNDAIVRNPGSGWAVLPPVKRRQQGHGRKPLFTPNGSVQRGKRGRGAGTRGCTPARGAQAGGNRPKTAAPWDHEHLATLPPVGRRRGWLNTDTAVPGGARIT
jgi:hypothetical protein